jgi:hypothetical protein
MPTKPKPKDSIVWVCETCEGQPTFEHAAFVQHAQEVHGLAKDATGKRSMMMHGDGKEFYWTTYRWKFEGWSAQQKITNVRRGADKAYWEDMP